MKNSFTRNSQKLDRLRELCKPILHIGEAALAALAAIPDTPDLVAADRAFLATHPPRLDREASPLAVAMGRAWLKLEEYLSPSTMRRLDQKIAERQEAGKAPPPRYRTGLFERLCGYPPQEPLSLPPPLAGSHLSNPPPGE